MILSQNRKTKLLVLLLVMVEQSFYTLVQTIFSFIRVLMYSYSRLFKRHYLGSIRYISAVWKERIDYDRINFRKCFSESMSVSLIDEIQTCAMKRCENKFSYEIINKITIYFNSPQITPKETYRK